MALTLNRSCCLGQMAWSGCARQQRYRQIIGLQITSSTVIPPSLYRFFSSSHSRTDQKLTSGMMSPAFTLHRLSNRARNPNYSTLKFSTLSPKCQQEPLAPHRARQLRNKTTPGTVTSATTGHSIEDMPPDAPSQLTSASAALPPSLKRTAMAFFALTKPRLSFLILLTTTASYALFPATQAVTAAATAATSSAVSSATSFFFLTTGTILCTASANALNMLYEPKSDALMIRTRNRPLVRGLVSPWQVALFAAVTAATGVGLLYWGSNPVVAGLGFSNIILYAGVYTPLKHMSVINTWAGAVVGAIPPLMGWAAASGEANSEYRAQLQQNPALASDLWGFISGFKALLLDYPAECPAPDTALFGGWLLAIVLFSWQFPHFNALAHPLREQYKGAGLRMLAWAYPRRNASVALRHSFILTAVTVVALPASGTVSLPFLLAATPASVWMTLEAIRFRRAMRTYGVDDTKTAKTAKSLFWASVWYLPIVLIAAMVTKPGLWDGVLSKLTGAGAGADGDDGDDYEEHDHKNRVKHITPDRAT